MRVHFERLGAACSDRRVHRFWVPALAALLLLCGAGCKQKQGPVGESEPDPAADFRIEPTAPQPSIPSPHPAAQTVVLTVNGTAITEAEIEQKLSLLLRQNRINLAGHAPQIQDELRRKFRGKAIDDLIAECLLGQQATALGINATDDEILGEITKIAGRMNPPLTLDQFKVEAAAQGRSFDELKEQVRKGLGYQRVMQIQWEGKTDVNDAEAEKFYKDNPAHFEIVEKVRASHILIEATTQDPNADPNTLAQARAKAEDLLKQIKEEGADFAELAKLHSGCQSSIMGGDVGLFGRREMVKAFEDAAFALKVGQVSDIVETKFGYHIIKVTDRVEPGTTSFEEAKSSIIDALAAQKRNVITQQYITSLRAKADVVYSPGYEPKPDIPGSETRPAPAPEGAADSP